MFIYYISLLFMNYLIVEIGKLILSNIFQMPTSIFLCIFLFLMQFKGERCVRGRRGIAVDFRCK